MAKLGSYLGREVYSYPLGSAELALPQSKIGIEIETEGWRGNAFNEISTLWTHKEDHSLRNNGREFVTIGNGLIGKQIVDAVRMFCEWANKLQLSDGYPRAGIHIHVDCTDMDVERKELQTFVGLYLLVEYALYEFAGPWRRHVGFCDALTESGVNVNALRTIWNNKDIKPGTFQNLVGNMDRYCGLNLAALHRYGTIEFRHLRTVYDPNIIINWINIILALKKAAQEWNPEQSVLAEFSRSGATGFVQKFMGNQWPLIAQYFNEDAAWTAVDNTLTLMQPVLGVPTNTVPDWSDNSYNPYLIQKNFA